MALSAAELQKRHNLEGAPDPFPSLATDNTAPATKGPAQTKVPLDTSSQSAFPSLAPNATSGGASSGGNGSNSAWGSKIKVQPKAVFTDTFTLGQIEFSGNRLDGGNRQAPAPTSLAEVMKLVMHKYKVKIDASANTKARQTTFHLKADSQKDLDKARRSLMAQLSPVITLTIQAPASTIASIIGPKGATLKHIRDLTTVRVDIPPREQVMNGHSATNGAAPSDHEEEEPTVPVVLNGPNTLVYEAQSMVNDIISSKTSKTSQRVKDIPSNVLPFIIARRPLFVQAAEGADVQLALHSAEKAITVSGDREAVTRVVETIRATIENVKNTITSLKISLPKRQHRLFTPKAIDAIMSKSRCTVAIAPLEEPSDEITVWGNPADLPTGLSAVMETGRSAFIQEFPLPGPVNVARQILSYLVFVDYPKAVTAANPGVTVFLPSLAAADRGSALTVDIAGEQQSQVESAARQVADGIAKLTGATRELDIDWLLHKAVAGKNAKKIRQFHDTHNVSVYFPNEAAENSRVLLVYDPLGSNASASADEKSKHLDAVATDMMKFVKEAGEIKTSVINVEKEWHASVVGENRTTLNAIIGEEKVLSIKIGSETGDAAEDTITIRGPSADVDRAIKEISSIVDHAKNDLIDNSYELDFDVDREYVGRIVGAHGAGVNKLRDQLGVRVDVQDESDDKEFVTRKKKGATSSGKSKVKITGREENVREAKKRILAQIERLADETTEILKIPAQYHSGLIGQSGKYAIRLEEKYSVKITFPGSRGGAPAEQGEGRRETLKADEVLVRGGKKGVALTKAELMDAVEFEKENSNSLRFTVPSRCVPRILGKGGASINGIKDEFAIQVDIEKAVEDAGLTSITVRGTKKGITGAKSAIMAIADQVGEEVSDVVYIDAKFHRNIIGAGGSGLKDLIRDCGGPADSRTQAGLIRFPRQGEQPSDEVRLKGDPQLVAKLKAKLEQAVEGFKDRVVVAVEIPSTQHRSLIGRGGMHLTEFQNKHDVQVQFPGSRAYGTTDEPTNANDMVEVDPRNIVKVSGTRRACDAAVLELKAKVKDVPAETVTGTIEVPLKYHHFVSQQGAFFRVLRNMGVHVEQSASPAKSAIPLKPPVNGNHARIDDQEGAPVVHWDVTENYVDAEEGESTWTLRAKDEAALEKAKENINKAVEHAKNMTHVGFLTLPNRNHFPRIVGSKGANVSRLRNETGAEITVGKEDCTIVIIGAEDSINAAKDAILKMTNESSTRSGGRGGSPK